MYLLAASIVKQILRNEVMSEGISWNSSSQNLLLT